MAVSAFDPYAGKRRDVLERIYNENLELAKHSAKSSNSGKHTGCKCESCGSRDYAMTKSGSICTYCRAPEKTSAKTVGLRNRYADRQVLGNYPAGLTNFYGQAPHR